MMNNPITESVRFSKKNLGTHRVLRNPESSNLNETGMTYLES